MADYYVDLSGNVTKSKKKRKTIDDFTTDYFVDSEGSVTKKSSKVKSVIDTGIDFAGLTNDGYKSYLDNIKSNTTEEKQVQWLSGQHRNLSALQDKDVRKYISVLHAYDNGTGKRYAGEATKASRALQQLGYSAKDISSMIDTYKREDNAARTMKMQQNVAEDTEGVLESVGHSIGSVGASIVSGVGAMENVGALIKEKMTGEYVPVDTNEAGYREGAYRDAVRQNVAKKILGEEPNLARKALSGVYQAGMSVVDSTAAAALQVATGIPATAILGASAGTGTSKETFERTGSASKALATGVASGSIEALTEAVSLGNLWDIYKKSGKAAAKSTLANVLAQIGIEGSEETASELLNRVADDLINADKSQYRQNVKTYMESGLSKEKAEKNASADFWKQTLTAFAMGGLAGGMGAGVATVAGNITQNSLSQNEKKVVEKEVENRVTERKKAGQKVDDKTKSKIRSEVTEDLKKGYISTDTIESALGGETYGTYKNLSDEMEEYNSLNKMKAMEMTGEQSDRLAELKEKNKTASYQSEKTRLKEQLSKEVSEMTLNDRFLQESYNEKSKRSQAFEADTNTYDEKMQATIQKAIDSGILNNTRRTHEFVDMIAKISADKGVSFDFTNNQKLKESGFAKEGVSVNGYIKDGNVTLNINSAKALNKVVGHEITHALEDSDLYAELQEAVKAYATTKGEYNLKLEAITKLYEGVEAANIEQELTADLIGEYLFTDEAFVQQLSSKNRNVFQKIYDEIKYLIKTVTSGSKEAKQLQKVKKIFDEVYKEHVDTLKTSQARYSLMEFSEDGKRFVEIDQEQECFEGRDRSEYPRIAKDIINEKFNGKVIGIDNQMFVNGRGRDEYTHPSKPIKEEHIYDAKMRASSEIDNLLDAGVPLPSEVDGRDGHTHENTLNWEYYKTLFKVGQYYFEGVVNIQNIQRGKLFKDVTKIKDVTEAIMSSYGQNPKSQFLRTSSTNSISQNQEKTTENQKFSLGDDDIPTGNWNIKGEDILLEDIPIRQDVVPAQKQEAQQAQSEEWNPEVSDDLENGPFSPTSSNQDAQVSLAEEFKNSSVKESNRLKLENYQQELQRVKRLAHESYADFSNDIAEKQKIYDSKKNKNTKEAQKLLRTIERLKERRDDIQIDYGRRENKIQEKIDKMNSKEFRIAEQRQSKQEEYRELLGDLMGDTSTWQDKKMGISYQTNTLRRNLRDVVRDADGKRDIARADAIYEELQGKYNEHEAELNREANRIKKVYADMKINKAEDAYIQMLGEYRHNPDTTITPDIIRKYYEKHKDKIDTNKVDKAIESARKLYDSLFFRVNSVLKEQGMKEIGYREGYFPHFTEDKQHWLAKLFNWKTQNNDIPTDIAGLTEQFRPDRSWQSFNKHRTGDTTDYSFMKGLDTYVKGSLDWIYHIEDIQKRRAFENEIRYRHSEQGVKDKLDAIHKNEEYDADEMQAQIDAVLEEAKNPLNNFVTDLRKGTNVLAGKKDSGDRYIEEKTSRKIYSTMTNISNRVTANMVAGSVSSALTNFIPITQSWGQVSPVSSVIGMAETIKSYVADDGIVDKSNFLTNRLRQNTNLYQTGWDKAENAIGFLMEAVDNFTSQTVWRSKYMENIKNGMSEDAAIKNADQFAENVIAGRSRGNMPTIFNEKNLVTKMVTAFQLEVANQYGYMLKDMPQDMRNQSKGKLVKGYVSMFVGAYAYNALYSALTGRDAAFDPIRILQELFGNLFGDDEEEGSLTKAITNLAANIVEETPFIGGLVGGGRIPISSALPYEGLSVETLSGVMNDLSEGNMKNFWQEILKPVYYVAMPMGGGQTRKTIQGLQMFDDDLPIAGSYTNSGKLRFSVDDDFPTKAQAAVFGQYANKNAREYFDEGRAPLNEKKTQELADLDIPISDYWDIEDGLKGKKKLADKAEYIANLDLPVAKKNILINNRTTRKEDIDLTDYSLFDDFEEFDFAMSNKEEYQVARVAGGYKKYATYKDGLSRIKADKDTKGNSISGSRKKKIATYLNNIDATYEEKLILFRREYPSDDRYNREIVEYLNKRKDITYSQMATILKELGFTVEADGTVRW